MALAHCYLRTRQRSEFPFQLIALTLLYFRPRSFLSTLVTKAFFSLLFTGWSIIFWSYSIFHKFPPELSNYSTADLTLSLSIVTFNSFNSISFIKWGFFLKLRTIQETSAFLIEYLCAIVLWNSKLTKASWTIFHIIEGVNYRLVSFILVVESAKLYFVTKSGFSFLRFLPVMYPLLRFKVSCFSIKIFS